MFLSLLEGYCRVAVGFGSQIQSPSVLSHEVNGCPGDRYMKINMDNCTSDGSQCEARCDGTTSSHSVTSKLENSILCAGFSQHFDYS